MNTSLLVVSCDKYADLWTPFFNLFWKYWPDCPYPIYLGTNERTYNDKRVRMINVGPDVDWSTSLLMMIDQIKTPYVILTLEDFFLQETVNSEAINSALVAIKKLDGTMITLQTRSRPKNRVEGYPWLNEFSAKSGFRVSCQAALWDRNKLKKLICPGESPWQFEVNCSDRSRYQAHGFYGLIQSAFPYHHHVVEKGKWFPWEAKKFDGANIGCDFSARPIMTPKEALQWRGNKVLSYFKKIFPWHVRQRLKRVSKRANYRKRP